MGLFQKSSIDFNSSKHLFNHYIYLLASPTSSYYEHSLDIIKSYFALFMLSNFEATSLYADGDQSMDWSKILGLRQSQNNQMEFSKESHRSKLSKLIRSFNKYLLKQIASKDTPSSSVVELMAVFEMLAQQMGDTTVPLVVEINSEDIEKRIIAVMQSKEVTSSLEAQFVVQRFVSRCKCIAEGPLVKHVSQGSSPKGKVPVKAVSE